ncbi:hypothetical protein AVEN_268105-1, partial [Araneus ventricosus]
MKQHCQVDDVDDCFIDTIAASYYLPTMLRLENLPSRKGKLSAFRFIAYSLLLANVMRYCHQLFRETERRYK